MLDSIISQDPLICPVDDIFTMKTKSVPWEYFHSQSITSWTWRTPHFEAIIRSDGARYTYNLVDLSSGGRRPASDGYGFSFEEVEAYVLEFIGKAYPLSLGYRAYAGEHATTFSIYTAEKVDFGPMEGMPVRLKVKTKGGAIRDFTGLLQLDHFNILLTTHTGTKIKIPPSFIVEVISESTKRGIQKAGGGRTVQGEAIRGCTGTPGFTPGVVDHGPNSPWCPIHQI